MMTIKEFASLCQCNTQTLRYYDRIDLLKPVRVDPWSGYRFYTQEQAIDFVKIRNLQMADFTIAEIKALLGVPDVQVEAAFDRKIAAQVQDSIDEIPPMEAGREYGFFFRLIDESKLRIEFPMFMLGAMLRRPDAEQAVMGCTVRKSEDGQNHFALLRMK